MRTSPGKLITPSMEYARRAATTSRFSSASFSFESVASFVRSLSDISDRKAQKSSTEIGARIENRRRRSDTAAAPALERIDKSFPGAAKRNGSSESGAGGGESTYRST